MLETHSIKIRRILPSDNEEVFSYRFDSETNKYQGWVPKTLNEVDEFIAKNPKEFNTPDSWFQLVIIDKESDKIIGDIGVHFIDKLQCELGCTLDKNFHGKGFATEALKVVIDHLFLKLNKHRITTSIDPENIASIKLVERLGFKKEAHFRESLLVNGVWVDDIIYALLNSEWK